MPIDDFQALVGMQGHNLMQLPASRTITYKTWLSACLIVLLCPLAAHAEPGASTAHVPMLWMIAGAGAFVAAMMPLLIWVLTKPRRPARRYCIAAIVVAILFLVFVGPVIVVLGSILITGRTM